MHTFHIRTAPERCLSACRQPRRKFRRHEGAMRKRHGTFRRPDAEIVESALGIGAERLRAAPIVSARAMPMLNRRHIFKRAVRSKTSREACSSERREARRGHSI